MFSMSHNNGVVTNLRGELLFEYKDSPPCEDDGGVGSFNHPRLGKTTSTFQNILYFGILCYFCDEHYP